MIAFLLGAILGLGIFVCIYYAIEFRVSHNENIADSSNKLKERLKDLESFKSKIIKYLDVVEEEYIEKGGDANSIFGAIYSFPSTIETRFAKRKTK